MGFSTSIVEYLSLQHKFHIVSHQNNPLMVNRCIDWFDLTCLLIYWLVNLHLWTDWYISLVFKELFINWLILCIFYHLSILRSNRIAIFFWILLTSNFVEMSVMLLQINHYDFNKGFLTEKVTLVNFVRHNFLAEGLSDSTFSYNMAILSSS